MNQACFIALQAQLTETCSQSILRNAAIPNYLKPMAFQKVWLANPRIPLKMLFRSVSLVANWVNPWPVNTMFRQSRIFCVYFLSYLAILFNDHVQCYRFRQG
jgi:hypothetical protein